jgi:hypothetical protein
MSSTTRRVFSDFMLFATGVVILLFALVVFDDRFRQQLSLTVSGSGEIVGAGKQVNELAIVTALIVSQFARNAVSDHLHWAVFTAAAIVLVIFLTRL